MKKSCTEGSCQGRVKRNFILSLIALAGAMTLGFMSLQNQLTTQNAKSNQPIQITNQLD